MRIFLFFVPLFLEVRAEKILCDRYLSKIREIQIIQNDFSSPDGSVSSLQGEYDRHIAQLTILKGIRELKDDYLRNQGSLKKILTSNMDDLNLELEKDIQSSKKLLSLEDLLEQIQADKKLLEANDSDEFLLGIKKSCDKQDTTLCRELDEVEPMVRGISTSLKIQEESADIEKYKAFLEKDLPSKNQRVLELNLAENAYQKSKKLKQCQVSGRKCDPERSSLEKQIQEIQRNMNAQLEENLNKLQLRDSLGNVDPLIEVTALNLNKENVPGRAEILNNLNKKIKQNFEVAYFRSQVRGKKIDEKMPPIISEKNISNIFNDAFNLVGCSSGDLNKCLEKLSQNSDQLDLEISKLESLLTDVTNKLDRFTTKENYKKMEEMKAILISLAQEECRDEKKPPMTKVIPCSFSQDVGPERKATNFALVMGRVIAEVEPNLFLHKQTTQFKRKQQLNKLCQENFSLVGSRFTSRDLCSNIPLSQATILEKISGSKKPVKGQCGPAPYCLDWMSFYRNYDIERDDSGNILSIKRVPSWSEMIAPELAKSVLTLAPVGLQMYQSDQYLKVMQNQAAYQMNVNSYRKKYPLHTFLWDRGYRGFKDGYVGGPTLKNPGVTGYGALGNPFAGQGEWNPYGLSGVLPYQLGMYSYNPYFNGNFQFGATYSYNQLKH